MASLVILTIIGVAVWLIVTGTIGLMDERLPHRRGKRRRSRKRKASGWSPPAELTDEDRTWVDYMSRMDLDGWVAYQSRATVDSLPGAAVLREHKVDRIAPLDAVANIEKAMRLGRDLSSHDVIAAVRGGEMTITRHNEDGSCVLELKRRNGSPVFVTATRELMMQVTGRGAPGALVPGGCKFHGWVTEVVDVGSLDPGMRGRKTKTTCIDCGADYDNPRSWNGGW